MAKTPITRAADALGRAIMKVEPRPDPRLWHHRSCGALPRVGYHEASPVPFLAVSRAPGHPRHEGMQALWRAHLEGRDQFDAFRAWQHESRFVWTDRVHLNGIRRYLSELLLVPEAEVWREAAYTPLIKVSPREKLQPLLPEWVAEWWPWFQKEVELYRPALLIALGTEVASHLRTRIDAGQLKPLPLLVLPEPNFKARWPEALARIHAARPLLDDLLESWREQRREVA